MITPPTHVRLAGRKGPTTHQGDFIHDALNTSWCYDIIEALYVFGSIVDGNFIPNVIPNTAVHTVVDNTEYESPDTDQVARMAARQNLRNAGVTPDPQNPTNAKVTPSKKQDDFKNCDLDAYFSVGDPRLKGTVVPD
jgi:hypothetical protein